MTSEEPFELIETFDNLLADLNGDWRLHKELFQVPEHYVLFADSAPIIWHMLRDALTDSVFMSIARLLDPPLSVGKENLSLARLLQQMPPGAERDELRQQYDELVTLYNSALRHWRNRKLSHNDLLTTSGMAPLPDVSYKEISELIERINKLGRRIGHVVQNIDKSFVPHVTNDAWVWRLIESLKKGVSHEHSVRSSNVAGGDSV
jgi:hypothetical protein